MRTGTRSSYAWDLDDDGQFDDGTAVSRTTSFSTPGNHTIRLRVSDGHGGTDTDAKTISVANAAPVPVIDTPSSAGSHPVGQVVSFSGHATDPDEGPLPASALSWTIAIEHCPSDCHEHIVDQLSDIASGSFAMPDHTYPSHVELRLTATDEFGKSVTVAREIDYALAVLHLRSSPTGATLLLDGTTYKVPADVTVLRGSAHQLEATPTQTLSGAVRSFVKWSDGGARSHTIVASADRTFTATYSGPDVTAPSISLLRATTQVGATAGPSVPGRIRWNASDSGTGISRYDLQRSTDGGAHWTSITLSPVTRKDAFVTLSPGTAYRFRLRAHDAAGNMSGWATIAFRPAAVQENASGVTYPAPGRRSRRRTSGVATCGAPMRSARRCPTRSRVARSRGWRRWARPGQGAGVHRRRAEGDDRSRGDAGRGPPGAVRDGLLGFGAAHDPYREPGDERAATHGSRRVHRRTGAERPVGSPRR